MLLICSLRLLKKRTEGKEKGKLELRSIISKGVEYVVRRTFGGTQETQSTAVDGFNIKL